MAVDAAEAATADDAERSFDPVAGGASAVSAEQESTENIGGARNGEEGASPPSSSAWTPPECPGSAVVHVRLVPSAVDPGNVALDVALTSGGSAVPAGVTGDRKETADLKGERNHHFISITVKLCLVGRILAVSPRDLHRMSVIL
jgi:hypothetical protein